MSPPSLPKVIFSPCSLVPEQQKNQHFLPGQDGVPYQRRDASRVFSPAALPASIVTDTSRGNLKLNQWSLTMSKVRKADSRVLRELLETATDLSAYGLVSKAHMERMNTLCGASQGQPRWRIMDTRTEDSNTTTSVRRPKARASRPR